MKKIKNTLIIIIALIINFIYSKNVFGQSDGLTWYGGGVDYDPVTQPVTTGSIWQNDKIAFIIFITILPILALFTMLFRAYKRKKNKNDKKNIK